jgi:hypothetical protein
VDGIESDAGDDFIGRHAIDVECLLLFLLGG